MNTIDDNTLIANIFIKNKVMFPYDLAMRELIFNNMTLDDSETNKGSFNLTMSSEDKKAVAGHVFKATIKILMGWW